VRLGDLAAALPARLSGDPERTVSRVTALTAAGPGDLAVCIQRRFLPELRQTRATAVLIDPRFVAAVPEGCASLSTSAPRDAFTRSLRLLNVATPFARPGAGIDARAAVDPTAILGEGVSVGPFVYIGPGARLGDAVALSAGCFVGAGAEIGARTVLHPRAVVMDACVVGADCLIGPGAVVGATGFGLDAAGRLPHLGRVVIEDAVTLGANTCVDRATLGETHIGRGAHLDNLVQVGHNARVGAGAVLCGQVGLAGGAVVEAGAVLGGQAGVAGGAIVGQGARVAAQSGVTQNLAPEAEYSGHPAEPNRPRLRRIARLRRLVEP
jgi:UDP-3-O-[3-hydroxymyristoyl] glucosamine N-acyltransferase